MIITISGNPGSGKSTVAKILSKKLGYEYYSTGKIFRSLAKEINMDIQEFSELAETDKSIDKRIDEHQILLGKSKKDFILEGRLGFFFIPSSFKIFLKVEEEEGVKRIINDNREDERFINFEQAIIGTRDRKESESKRYKELYNVNPDDESNYDLIIDSTKISALEVVKIIKEKIKI